jgi:phage-related holin
LAFVIFQISVVWNISQIIVTNKAEQFLFGNFSCAQIGLYSIAVVTGPLNEAFQMTLASIKKLSGISKD